MARPANRTVLASYRKKIDHSRKWRKEEKYDKLWRRMIDLYKGKHYLQVSEEDRMLVNVCFATINVIGPSVAVNHPKITVGARKSEDATRLLLLRLSLTIGGVIMTAKSRCAVLLMII